ncbi:spinocerebellar ataxia type 10 protein domain-containing protein [Exophiala viscosa]|uniref:spinocerebellar ataxia type 10 protein domain-containing protein n=1 Tax=Exophiala viscosa TaxID=2486360 RepID=UPI00219E01C7|nr:spinocerebellar ataxia type 10 protein domain-containing protein [Exophiala viscosa]
MSASTLLQIVLTGTQTHYENRGLIDDKRLDHLLRCGKQILYKSHQESDVRSALGFNPRVWEGLTRVLSVAIPALEQQSFAWKNPPASSYNGSSSELIAAHYLSLVKDIERLNDLCTIARNLLATTKKAQNLAAEKSFDQQILKLIDVCVRVTARGYDGEANPRNEERWQKVVNLYKRLLITCLQFLHNFIMHNEQRKLVLWLDLFGQSQTHGNEGNIVQEPEMEDGVNNEATASREDRIQSAAEKLASHDQQGSNGELAYNVDDVHALFDMMSTNKEPDEKTQEAARVLMDKIRADMETLSGMSASQLDSNPDALLKVGADLRAHMPVGPDSTATAIPKQIEQNGSHPVTNGTKANGQAHSTHPSRLPDLGTYSDLTESGQDLAEEDLKMSRTAQSAAATLQEAKDELMARLHESAPIVDENGDQIYDEDGNPEGEYDDDLMDSVEDSMEEEEDDDEDYRGSGDQERGLLTDVPLVLGPTEIEALPMIIQAGIVDNFGSKNGERQGVKNMQAVRCHILLAQEAGRNVLRELLIFIAAWDLPDDEFYFKMMVQIMEAILKNGLMSHAYSDFGQPKDIISPAQAVVIKILTHIFRAKYSPASASQDSNEQPPPKPRVPAPLSRVDVLTVRYIFIVFRGNIIPETCALIYLQGQIRAGLALAEDFPLNLWDMERVYEGVYQFLEFFAVLTENNDWKRLLVQWEIVYDLVTLIKELDNSIAKVPLTKSMPPATANAATNGTTAIEPESATSTTAAPVAVERPYDAAALDPVTQQPADQNVESESLPPPSNPSPPPAVTEEPADFEWRNLKKLIVLVLSSLVWKSPTVQNQIREYGGVETILSCTQYDACNPYIKEHAVMCLKFLLESNPENQALVSSLEAREVAPTDTVTKEALEKMGANLDVENGKVKITAASRKASWVKNQIAERERERSRGSVKENGRVLGEIDDVADLIDDTHLREDSGTSGNGTEKGKGKEKVVQDDDDDEIEFM